MGAWLWVVVVVLLVVIVWVVVSRSRRRQLDARREEAAQLRDPAADHSLALREQEASAAAAQAQARQAQAEADQRAAEAQQAQVAAERETARRDQAAAENEAQLRRADALDPDVETDAEGYRVDGDGNRIPTSGQEHHGTDDDSVHTASIDEGAKAGNWEGWEHGRDETRGSEAPPAVERSGDTGVLSSEQSRAEESDDKSHDESHDQSHDEGPLHLHNQAVGNFRRETPPGVEGDHPTGAGEAAGAGDHQPSEPAPAQHEGDQRSWQDRNRDRADELLAREEADGLADGEGRRG